MKRRRFRLIAVAVASYSLGRAWSTSKAEQVGYVKGLGDAVDAFYLEKFREARR